MKVNRALAVFFFIGMVLNTKAILAVAEAPRIGGPNLARAVQMISLACLNLRDFSPTFETKQKCIKDWAKPAKSVPHINPSFKAKSYRIVGHRRGQNGPHERFKSHDKAEQSLVKEKALLVNLYKEWYRIERKISKIQRRKIKEMLLNLERSLKELATLGDLEISENMTTVILEALPMFIHKAYIMNEFVKPLVSSLSFTDSNEKMKHIELSIRETVRKVIEQKIAEKLSLLDNSGEENEETEIEKHFYKRRKKPFKPKNHKKDGIEFQIAEGRADYLEDRSQRFPDNKPGLSTLGERWTQ